MKLLGVNGKRMVTIHTLKFFSFFKFKNINCRMILLYNTRSHEDAHYVHNLHFSQVLKLFLKRPVMKYLDDILVFGRCACDSSGEIVLKGVVLFKDSHLYVPNQPMGEIVIRKFQGEEWKIA